MHRCAPWSNSLTIPCFLSWRQTLEKSRELVIFQISEDGWQTEPRIDSLYVAFSARTKMKKCKVWDCFPLNVRKNFLTKKSIDRMGYFKGYERTFPSFRDVLTYAWQPLVGYKRFKGIQWIFKSLGLSNTEILFYENSEKSVCLLLNYSMTAKHEEIFSCW